MIMESEISVADGEKRLFLGYRVVKNNAPLRQMIWLRSE
jgi:hypothetical protein